MPGTLAQFVRQIRQPAIAAVAAAAMTLPALSTSSAARGPDTIADTSERVIDAVVNISTSQKVEARNSPLPQLPNDPQLDELFRDFFNRRGQGDPQNRERGPRRVNSLGSGFIIDPSGIVVTNNHVISEADEITVILNDGARLKAELDGEVVGVNTAIISPSGGSIGIGFAVPSKTAMPVIDQLKQFGETRRGWLGVRIQQVTDEIADSLKISPPRGALVAGVDDKGPAKPAGIEPGDVIVRFDGKDVKDPKDLSRVVADTAVDKEVDAVIIR